MGVVNIPVPMTWVVWWTILGFSENSSLCCPFLIFFFYPILFTSGIQSMFLFLLQNPSHLISFLFHGCLRNKYLYCYVCVCVCVLHPFLHCMRVSSIHFCTVCVCVLHPFPHCVCVFSIHFCTLCVCVCVCVWQEDRNWNDLVKFRSFHSVIPATAL